MRVKKYFETDPTNWQAPSSMSIALYRPSDTRTLRPVSSKSEDLKGVKTKVISLAGPVEPPDPNAKHHWNELNLRSGTYWILDQSFLPQAAGQCVQKMFALPKVLGLPLQITTCNQRGSVKKEIELTNVQTVTVTQAMFLVPAGYAKAKAQGELWLDDRTEGVQELMESGR
jgi:hypothetical protein